MESKFTKGKWVFEERPANWFDILEEKSRRNVLRSDLLGHEQLLANAQLIASAPEMFEMLKKLLESRLRFEIDYIEIKQLLTKITSND